MYDCMDNRSKNPVIGRLSRSSPVNIIFPAEPTLICEYVIYGLNGIRMIKDSAMYAISLTLITASEAVFIGYIDF